MVGNTVGCTDGLTDGANVGATGATDGVTEGDKVGVDVVGRKVGACDVWVGKMLGVWVGILEG